jgi:hypothetical protein
MTEPRRLLDPGSEASPALRALLASAKRGDDPRAPQIEALSARLAVSVAPNAPIALIAPMAPTPQLIATAAARANYAAICVKAGAAIVALGVLCAGVLYVRAIRDDARTQVETRRAIERDARQILSPTAPRAPGPASPASPDPASPASPGPASPGPASPGPASPDPASPDPASPDPASPDPASIEKAALKPSPTPSLDSASAPPRPATGPKQIRVSGDSEAETKLVLTAGAALVRDDAETALALTREHFVVFPNGAHAEERDRIAIEALVRLGGLDDARTAAEQFFLRYPQSIYRSRIDGLLR